MIIFIAIWFRHAHFGVFRCSVDLCRLGAFVAISNTGAAGFLVMPIGEGVERQRGGHFAAAMPS